MALSKFLCSAAAMTLALSTGASAATLAGVGTYEGVAGIGSPNGVVTAPPIGDKYLYVTTAGSSFTGAGLGIGSETNGSYLTTSAFSANEGSLLSYYFNYVTSDGASFIEYAYALLTNLDTGIEQLIFTARTTPSGDTVPGAGLPPIADGVTLTPSSTEIIPGGPVWAELAGYSGACYSAGCGYTGWINSEFTIADAGMYSLTFGVVNWADTWYDSGMAIAGITVDGEVIVDPGPAPVPLPAAGYLLAAAVGSVAMIRRRTRA
ncbi:NF038132 family protein [Frigidibacter sp. MR17.14]|uniref:NF038132 family protein n=1 Tax=Frigidibacter sp. MR17.14 TaxID=3126509 RepID=UPI0030130149